MLTIGKDVGSEEVSLMAGFAALELDKGGSFFLILRVMTLASGGQSTDRKSRLLPRIKPQLNQHKTGFGNCLDMYWVRPQIPATETQL